VSALLSAQLEKTFSIFFDLFFQIELNSITYKKSDRNRIFIKRVFGLKSKKNMDE